MELDMDDHLVPKFALIGYASTPSHYNTEHYFAYHRIVGECLTAGMPLTKDTARNLFRCLEGELIKFSFKGLTHLYDKAEVGHPSVQIMQEVQLVLVTLL